MNREFLQLYNHSVTGNYIKSLREHNFTDLPKFRTWSNYCAAQWDLQKSTTN